ncbi:MAG: hypothetical protein QM783_17275 [Phycisphaerales bacterium]
MNAQNTIVAMVVAAAGLACAAEADVITNWTSVSPSTVTGTLGGVPVVGQIAIGGGGSFFNALLPGYFTSPTWAAGADLPSDAIGVGTVTMPYTATQVFTFGTPITGLRMYINFLPGVGGPGTVLAFSTTGATGVTTVASTPDIITSSSWVVSSGQQGDCVLAFSGAVTSISVSYPQGIVGGGATEITFTAVPAPSAAALAASAGLLGARRRRR